MLLYIEGFVVRDSQMSPAASAAAAARQDGEAFYASMGHQGCGSSACN